MVFCNYTGRGFSFVIPPIPSLGDGNLDDEDFSLPAVIIWNPYIAYPHIFKLGSIQCPVCDNSMYEAYWNDGSSTATQPRLIHAMDNVALLVSAVYKCKYQHKLLAHDSSVLQKFPSMTMIPFLLLARTGFTTDIVDMCTSFCRRGLNFYNMESLILERRWETFARQQQMIEAHKLMTKQNPTISNFLDSQLSKSPSNDILSKCFIAKFLQDEPLYLREMVTVPCGNSISFDHTFKTAANIGYLREDHVWVPQYNSLFLVANREGQVLTWQLTKGTSFSQVKTILLDLKERAQHIQTVYIDECCKLREKVKSVFGPHVSVKLDLFHAVQRITRTLPKRHPLIGLCTQELRLVFRKDGDTGEKRMYATPAPSLILENLDAFVTKWRHIQDREGKTVFTSDTFTAVANLKRHISTGCVSDIPPGAGTNRNERFHRHIKSFFHRSRVGILLAYALLTVIIHAHNTSATIAGKVVTRPIAASPVRSVPTCSVKAIGIVPEVREEQSSLSSDHWEVDLSQNMMDMELISSIYWASLQKLTVMKAVAHMGLNLMLNVILKFKPFPLRGFDQTDVLVQQKLSTHGLFLSPAPADGNCFFKAVALNFMANPERWSLCLTRAGIFNHDSLTLDTLSHQLRQLSVHELMGGRRMMYEDFIPQGDDYYSSEASKFLQDGYYDSALGNIIPLALATALQVPFIIFSKNQHTPLMYITPEIITVDAAVSLVYTPSGPGHYDAALPCSTPASISTKPVQSIRCSCGINKKTQGPSCKPNPFYNTRCKCYKNSRSCSPLCHCKECANPNGIRQPQQGMVKKRRRHTLQVEIPSSKRFALDRGESISSAIWSDFESIVLHETCTSLPTDAATSLITKVYNDVVYYSTSCFCTSPLTDDMVLREKTHTQITSKIQHISTHTLAD